MEPSHDQTAPARGGSLRRRTLFRWLTDGLGAVATVILAIPFVGYILGMRKRPVQWVSLGSVGDFPPDETRLVTFDNPIRQPWDGMAAHIGVYVRRQGEASSEKTSSWCSPPIVPTWVVRSPGFPSRVCSCARVTVASITRPASAPRGRRHVGSFTASGGCAMGSWRSRRRIIRPCRTRWKNRRSRRPPGSLALARLRLKRADRWDAG